MGCADCTELTGFTDFTGDAAFGEDVAESEGSPGTSYSEGWRKSEESRLGCSSTTGAVAATGRSEGTLAWRSPRSICVADTEDAPSPSRTSNCGAIVWSFGFASTASTVPDSFDTSEGFVPVES